MSPRCGQWHCSVDTNWVLLTAFKVTTCSEVWWVQDIHARAEKIHSEIHVISFFATTDVLGNQVEEMYHRAWYMMQHAVPCRVHSSSVYLYSRYVERSGSAMHGKNHSLILLIWPAAVCVWSGGGQGAVQLDVKHTALCLSTMTPHGTCIPTNILWFWMSPSLGNTAGFLYATVGGRFCLWEKMHDCSDFTPNTCGATGAWTTKTAIEQD